MAGLKILPIRKKSIEKACTTIYCKTDKQQSVENSKKDMAYPQEYFLTEHPTILEEKKTHTQI